MNESNLDYQEEEMDWEQVNNEHPEFQRHPMFKLHDEINKFLEGQVKKYFK